VVYAGHIALLRQWNLGSYNGLSMYRHSKRSRPRSKPPLLILQWQKSVTIMTTNHLMNGARDGFHKGVCIKYTSDNGQCST